MHPKLLIDKLDETKIVAAIKQAEQIAAGEIRVTVSHGHPVNVLSAARSYFFRSGMNRIPRRNAVLIYFAPRAHTFAIWGDIGVHEKCGDEFWQAVTATVSPRLKNGQFTEAIVEAVHQLGEQLARDYPRRVDRQNGLPDAVIRD